MKRFEAFLREELNNYEGDFDKFILYAPDFFKLLCELLDEDLDNEDKRKINSALAYFVLPNDILPEETSGPLGYVDDIYVCCVVLKNLSTKYGIARIGKLWNQDEDFEVVLNKCFKGSENILKEKNLINIVLNKSALNEKNG